MTTTSHLVAAGPGWRVDDVVCTAGPHDPSFEERHEDACIAIVSDGAFQYRTTHGSALLAPGSILLGDAGACFECGHDHGSGDRCLSFHYAPAFLEFVISGAPDVRTSSFRAPRLPPLQAFASLVADAEAARTDGDASAFEEIALRLAGAVARTLADSKGETRAPTPRDERRVMRALQRIDAEWSDPSGDNLSVAALAREAAMSPFHFLRAFRRVVGVTPHQFLLSLRLSRAAVRLTTTDESVSAIAYRSGFGDLSTFNRRFRRIVGVAPGAYRARRRADR